MRKIALVILAIALMAIIASAQTVNLEGRNVVVKHTFYSTLNGSANIKFVEQESMTIITKNGNVTIKPADWGKDSNAILLQVSYQNTSELVILERVWGMQVAEMQLAKNVSLTVGLMDTFWGTPTRYAKICTSLWVLG